MSIGNIMFGQSGGPSPVINSSLAGAIDTAKKLGAEKIYGMRHGIEGLLAGKYVDLSEYIKDDLDLELLKRTPSSYLGSCRFKLPAPVKGDPSYEKIFKTLNELGIKHFFYNGGNDSMDTIKNLYDYGQLIGSDIHFMGVPKTIDNDLAVTDHTPGFGSVAKYVATIVKEVILDAKVYNVETVTVIEIMGRNAGWLTAAAALAKGPDSEGPDLIYLPETPFVLDNCVAKVKEILKTKKSVVIAVSEGITDESGESVSASVSGTAAVDAFGHKKLTGIGQAVADMVGKAVGCKSRAIELSYVQRCGSHIASRTDVTEAFQVGAAAMKASVEGKSGCMVTLKRVSDDPYMCVTDIYDVHEIANVEKKVPREWINKDHDNVTEEFIHYARPLIQGEVSQIMINGLPTHIVLPAED